MFSKLSILKMVGCLVIVQNITHVLHRYEIEECDVGGTG